MHELSLAESVVQIVEETRCAQGGGRVRTVCLEIGALAAVEVEALRFCFEVVVRDTAFADARLEIAEIPGLGCCKVCAQTTPVGALYDACPHCGGYPVEVVQGTEMRVKAIEIDAAALEQLEGA